MEGIITYKQAINYDPTHTTGIRNAFAANMKRRFNELAVTVKTAVVIEDCFGLKERPHTFQMSTPGYEAFNFARSPEKMKAFMDWLQKQVDAGIIEIKNWQQIGSGVESAWTNIYIADSYKRAVIRARYELIRKGFQVPSVEDSGGINVIMMSPFHVDALGLLFSRVFSDLKGITAAMDMEISRILAQGLADGDGAMLLARKLVATINGTGMGDLALTDTLGRFIPAMRRAVLLARTEIIRAYAEATLQEFRNWGVEGVTALAEFQTAGDDRVCPICSSLQGRVYTLEEASGVIPVHPLCRCCWLPWIEEIQKYK